MVNANQLNEENFGRLVKIGSAGFIFKGKLTNVIATDDYVAVSLLEYDENHDSYEMPSTTYVGLDKHIEFLVTVGDLNNTHIGKTIRLKIPYRNLKGVLAEIAHNGDARETFLRFEDHTLTFSVGPQTEVEIVT